MNIKRVRYAFAQRAYCEIRSACVGPLLLPDAGDSREEVNLASLWHLGRADTAVSTCLQELKEVKPHPILI